MKEIRSLINGLVGCGVALALVSTLAAQTPLPIDGKATVIRVKGSARYNVGNSGWKPLTLGQVLKPGSVVQTDMNKGSYIDLVLAEGSAPVPVVANTSGPTVPAGFLVPMNAAPGKPATAQNVVRIWENTVLGVDKLTSLQTGADVVTETQLDLKAGHVTAVVKKMSAASRYEIKIPDGVAGIRGTVLDIWANGNASCSDGSAILVRAKKTADVAPGTTPDQATTTTPPAAGTTSTTTPGETTTTTVLTDGQSFDAATGQTTQMTDAATSGLNSVASAASVSTTQVGGGTIVPFVQGEPVQQYPQPPSQ